MAMDFVLLEDLSGSFSDDLATVRTLSQPLIDAVRSIDAAARFGVSSFIDKPIGPFGDAGDYVYRTDLRLTSDTNQFKSTINGLTTRSGSDGPEAQLEGLLQVALRTTEVGWQAGAQKFVLLATDATFHKAGDFASRPPNDGDTVLDGTPAGTGEDYPTILQLASALVSKGIIPIFAVPAGLQSIYQDLVDDLGLGLVVNLNADSSDIADSIRYGLALLTGKATFVGGSGADVHTGGSGVDRIFGALGNDTLDGGAGNDTVDGGAGNDLVKGGAGNDVVHCGSGTDSADGGAGDDVITGGGGIDRLVGGAGNDRFSGAAVEINGDLLVDFGPGESIVVTDRVFSAARCTLSADRKTLWIDSDSNGSIDLSIGFGAAVTGSVVAATIGSGTELRFGPGGIVGTNGNDVLNGTPAGETISGLSGNDSLSGLGGNDALYGGNGHDYLWGGEGNDQLYGNDPAFSDAGVDRIFGGNGNDSAYGGLGSDTISGDNGDDFVKGDGDIDSIYGGNGNDILDGDIGNDTLYGGAGNDRLLGDTENDYLFGDDGNDVLFGDSGNDQLRGGLNVDTMTGGTGKDTFVFDDNETGLGVLRDRILDFKVAEQDKIDLRLIDANTATSADNAFVWKGAAALTGAGQLGYYVSGGVVVIRGSTDADAASEFEIQLTAGLTPQAAWFDL